MSFLILAHTHATWPPEQLAAAADTRIGQPLRRAGTLTRMALLACLDVLQQERWSGTPPFLSTALLWHSMRGPQIETERLLAAQQQPGGLLMPFEFLASQPSLLGAQLKPWVPCLEQALFQPCTASPHEHAWLQTLQLADLWLREGRCQRVICAALQHDADACHYAALSMTRHAEQLRFACHPVAQGDWIAPADHTAPAMPQASTDAALWNLLCDPLADAAMLQAPWATLHLQRLHAAEDWHMP